MAIGLVMTIPLALVCRVWGCGSAGLAAIWLTGLLAIAGTIALEAGTCYILFTMGLFGPHGTISMACSANYLLGARFGHILMGSLFIVVVWVDMLVRRKQRKQERPR